MTPRGGHAHFVGVAGVGMSAVAQAAVGCGWRVTGSDRFLDTGDRLPVLDQLSASGIELCAQDGRAASCADVVVTSTAIEAGNPDVKGAELGGCEQLHRSEMLARLCAGRELYAVAGTSGKSTVTAMLGYVLEGLGLDPFVVNGALVVDWMRTDRVGNVRAGSGPCVIEADESDRSLINYHPAAAVVTNISSDHFSAAEAERLFRQFASQVSGPVVGALGEPIEADNVEVLGLGGCRFCYRGHWVGLRVPGVHNVQNACRTLELCEALGLNLSEAIERLGSFRGVHRRLERLGERAGYVVIDDYGHNPAKIAAAWDAVAPWSSPVIGVWRPHGYGPLRVMMDELVALFSRVCRAGDRLLVLPVYDAGGTADRSVQSATLVSRLQAAGVEAVACASYDEVVAESLPHLTEGACALVMGARDPHLPELGRRLLCG